MGWALQCMLLVKSASVRYIGLNWEWYGVSNMGRGKADSAFKAMLEWGRTTMPIPWYYTDPKKRVSPCMKALGGHLCYAQGI